jgi:hypothetical protein
VIRASGCNIEELYLDELRFPGEPTTDWENVHERVERQGVPIYGFSTQLVGPFEKRR